MNSPEFIDLTYERALVLFIHLSGTTTIPLGEVRVFKRVGRYLKTCVTRRRQAVKLPRAMAVDLVVQTNWVKPPSEHVNMEDMSDYTRVIEYLRPFVQNDLRPPITSTLTACVVVSL